MNPRLLEAIRELQASFADSKLLRIRVLSNELMEEAALENNKVLAKVALIGYSLHKLSTKAHIVSHGKWLNVKRRVMASLERSASAIKKNDLQGLEKSLKGIVLNIKSIDSELGNFVQGLYEKATVKYAASAYSLGLSLSQATALTGASKKDVLEYIGATRIADRERPLLGISQRLKRLRKLI